MALRIGFAFNEKPSEEEEPPSSVSHDRFAEWDDPETIAVVAEALILFEADKVEDALQLLDKTIEGGRRDPSLVEFRRALLRR